MWYWFSNVSGPDTQVWALLINDKFTMFYILKIITIKEIRQVFREMLQEHETKQEGMFTKKKKNRY